MSYNRLCTLLERHEMSKKIYTAEDFAVEDTLEDDYNMTMAFSRFLEKYGSKAKMVDGIISISAGPRWLKFLKRDDSWLILYKHRMWGSTKEGETTCVDACGAFDEELEKIFGDKSFEEMVLK